jgi:hypothetical protein
MARTMTKSYTVDELAEAVAAALSKEGLIQQMKSVRTRNVVRAVMMEIMFKKQTIEMTPPPGGGDAKKA